MKLILKQNTIFDWTDDLVVLKVTENFYLGRFNCFHFETIAYKKENFAPLFTYFAEPRGLGLFSLEYNIVNPVLSRQKSWNGNRKKSFYFQYNSFYQSLLSKPIASKNRCLLKNHFAIMRTTYDWLFNSLHKIMIKSSQTQRRRPKKKSLATPITQWDQSFYKIVFQL